MTPRRLVLLMCSAEIAGMLSFACFQSLVTTFQAEWGLSNTEAGWISGIYMAGYVVAVPVLVSLTDRIDAKTVYLASTALGGIAALAYALVADGFWSALILRCLQGIGLAGTYMPGLKALSDHIDGPRQSRYVSFYTASFGVGAAASFALTGEVARLLDWHWAFGLTALGSVAAFVLAQIGLPRSAPATTPDTHVLDFRPVMRHRPVMGFIVGYCGHNWELFGFRAWVVAFLIWAEAGDPAGGIGISATAIAGLATLLGVPSSIFGNELAVRFGRRRTIGWVAVASVATGLAIAATASMAVGLVVALTLLYGVLLTGDSGALTAGTVGAAPTGQRGATLALHAFLGFAGAAAGPLAVGMVLDAAGGGASSWALGFVTMALGSVAVLGAVTALRPRPGSA